MAPALGTGKGVAQWSQEAPGWALALRSPLAGGRGLPPKPRPGWDGLSSRQWGALMSLRLATGTAPQSWAGREGSLGALLGHVLTADPSWLLAGQRPRVPCQLSSHLHQCPPAAGPHLGVWTLARAWQCPGVCPLLTLGEGSEASGAPVWGGTRSPSGLGTPRGLSPGLLLGH